MLLQKLDQISTLALLFQTSEDHFCARDVLLGVQEVVEEVGVIPDNARVLVGLGVRETFDRAGLTADEAMKGRTLLVHARFDGVALRALALEDLGAFSGIASRDLGRRCFSRHVCSAHGAWDIVSESRWRIEGHESTWMDK